MVKTIYPEETLSLNDWFKYIYTRDKIEYIEEKRIEVPGPLGFFKVDKQNYIPNTYLFSRLIRFLYNG